MIFFRKIPQKLLIKRSWLNQPEIQKKIKKKEGGRTFSIHTIKSKIYKAYHARP